MARFGAQNAQASQQFVPIREIRDGVVILNNGSLRTILMASSINFALKSQEEQRAVIAQFQNFLNSLDFSVQFHIESRNLDIRPYVQQLQTQLEKEDNQLLKTQISEYIDFIKTFTEDSDIMQKTFFVVVPYNRSIVDKSGGIIDSVKSLLGQSGGSTDNLDEESFQEARSQLQQRRNVVEQGLVRTGVRITQLGTEEGLELFYRLLNPGNLSREIRGGDQ